jgi:hypothetical protein
MRKPNPEKLLIRNICHHALSNTKEFQLRDQRLEVSIVNELTLQVKVYGKGNPLPAYFNVTVKGLMYLPQS